MVVCLACVDGVFVGVSGNVVSRTIHSSNWFCLGFVGFGQFQELGELWCFVWFVMIGDLGLWLET